MKTISTTILLIASLTATLVAQPSTIKLAVKYEGLDAKWISDLDRKTVSAYSSKGKSILLPAVVAKSGEEAIIEVIQEFRTKKSAQKDPVISCGIIVDLTPKIEKSVIRIIGKGVLRRSKNKSSQGVATRFEAQEVFVDLEISDGASKAVDLEDGGRMIISASLIDATGQPIKR